MEPIPARYDKYLFVCENERAEGVCCGPEGAELRERLKALVKARGLAGRVRVSRSGCQDACADGPNVLLMPDHVWFRKVRESDLETLVAAVESRL